jgi:Zn-dependent protease
MNFGDLLIMLPILLFSVIVHEVAHGWVALRCGDPTARDAGRLTFNPLPHIDPFMTILLPLFLIISHSGFVIGGAKPVPINPYNFRKGERDSVLVSFAGPASNILLAFLAFGLSLLVAVSFRVTGSPVFLPMLRMLNAFIAINLILANFNLIPVPPLDGSHILAYFLKGEAKRGFQNMQRAGFMPFILFIFLGSMIRVGGTSLFEIFLLPAFKLMGLFMAVLRVVL